MKEILADELIVGQCYYFDIYLDECGVFLGKCPEETYHFAAVYNELYAEYYSDYFDRVTIGFHSTGAFYLKSSESYAKMKEAINDVLVVLDGKGSPNTEWIKNRLLEAITNSHE